MFRKSGLSHASKNPQQKLIHKLDAAVAKLVKDHDGGICITCGKKVEGRNYHCGHFRSRQFMSTRFDPRNLAGQCAYDNMFGSGLPYEFGVEIDKRFGEGTARKLYLLSKKIKQWDIKELNQLFGAAKHSYLAYCTLYTELCPE